MLAHGRDELGYVDMTLCVDEIGPLGSTDIFYERGRSEKRVNDGSTVYEK